MYGWSSGAIDKNNMLARAIIALFTTNYAKVYIETKAAMSERINTILERTDFILNAILRQIKYTYKTHFMTNETLRKITF